jgi:hypothetical protein
MEVKQLTKDKYDVWNKFCLASENAWFWHTTDWLEFSLNFRPELNSRNLSFYIKDDTGVIAICPLILEEIPSPSGKIKQLSNSASGGLLLFPAIKNDFSPERRKKTLKLIFAQIDKLIVDNKSKKISLRIDPLASCLGKNSSGNNSLLKYGFLNSSLNTQIVDLSVSEEELFKAVRKGHKSDIKRGSKAYQIEIFDQNTITKEIFDQYRSLHHKAAGRLTRPLLTFEMMYQWIKTGKSVLCGIKLENRFIGFTLIVTYKHGAYYASAADDPDVQVNIPISHLIQWSLIEWLKKHGFKHYELGLQQFGPQLFSVPSQKNLDISLFKRGFGGGTVSAYRGIKYTDKEFMKKDLLGNMEKLIASYQEI